MTIVTKIDCYELDGRETKAERPQIIVSSHWNMNDRIILRASDGGNSYTVIADDLIRAIQNAQNHR